MPAKTNFILVANHTSFLDPFILAAAIPQRLHWVALRSIYHSTLLKWFMKAIKTLPTGSASEKMINLLTKNKNVALFPEGTRSFDGSLKEFRTGAAVLALKTGRPIVPCAIFGAYEAFPRHAKFPKFVTLKVRIGRPKYLLREFCATVDDVCLKDGIFKIRNSIKEMLYA